MSPPEPDELSKNVNTLLEEVKSLLAAYEIEPPAAPFLAAVSICVVILKELDEIRCHLKRTQP